MTMTNAIVPSSAIAISKTGLQVTRALTWDEWVAVGRRVDEVDVAIQWIIGDWINYGDKQYGEVYAQAVEFTRYDYHTLANFAYVSRAFEFSRRRENLTFSHHAAVAGLMHDMPQKAELLLDAAEAAIETEGRPLPVSWLDARVKELRGEQSENAETLPNAKMLNRIRRTIQREIDSLAIEALVSEDPRHDAIAGHLDRALTELDAAIAIIQDSNEQP